MKLAQTILWVLLVSGIVAYFRKPLYALLDALAERIKSGSDIKAGPFSLQMRPLAPSAQAERAGEEIREAFANSTPGTAAQVVCPSGQTGANPQPPSPTPAPVTSPTPTPEFRTAYFQAEDLALRALQAEFGCPIDRQVTAGMDGGFDGAFVLNNRLKIVEVKYLAGRPNTSQIRRSLDAIQGVLLRYPWKSVDVILAVVVDMTGAVDRVREELTMAVSSTPIPTELRVYSMTELQIRFGVADARNTDSGQS